MVVVGAGIAGLTAAYSLAKGGRWRGGWAGRLDLDWRAVGGRRLVRTGAADGIRCASLDLGPKDVPRIRNHAVQLSGSKQPARAGPANPLVSHQRPLQPLHPRREACGPAGVAGAGRWADGAHHRPHHDLVRCGAGLSAHVQRATHALHAGAVHPVHTRGAQRSVAQLHAAVSGMLLPILQCVRFS